MTTLTELAATARALVAPGKGILAADESFPTIAKRFDALGIAVTEENRRIYRELLFTTPGLGEYISAAILFDETTLQRTTDGRASLIEILVRQGIIPGIKVDKGAVPLPYFPGEKITQGLDGLRERLHEYRRIGARFTKWRAVIAIGADAPTFVKIPGRNGNLINQRELAKNIININNLCNQCWVKSTFRIKSAQSAVFRYLLEFFTAR